MRPSSTGAQYSRAPEHVRSSRSIDSAISDIFYPVAAPSMALVQTGVIRWRNGTENMAPLSY
jgi:hypothetical protein